MGTGSFPGVEAAGTWGWPRPIQCVEVLERVELYLYSPKGPSWPIKRLKIYLQCLHNRRLYWIYLVSYFRFAEFCEYNMNENVLGCAEILWPRRVVFKLLISGNVLTKYAISQSVIFGCKYGTKLFQTNILTYSSETCSTFIRIQNFIVLRWFTLTKSKAKVVQS